MQTDLDATDRKILRALQANGRITVTELAEAVNLSNTPCTERMRRLEREGFIRGFAARIDPLMLDLSVTVFVQVVLERTTTGVLNRFGKEVRRIPEVESAHMIAGNFDYLLKVRVRDMVHYRKILGDRIGTLPGVSQTHTFAVMETVKENAGIDPALI
ncbi:MAG: Lrp/AsnC ligand binding domain-containing protein [Salaquimonas sp.]|jgi:Lrp/AsnC family leucine-responsive transcriptional regulator|nr:Lrp/AsnC ligand binding domain-containing protein [Salaquimonas sp.]